MTTMQYPMQSGYLQPQQESKHYIMGYIAARWPNFGAGKKSEQKRQMIAVWEQDLADILGDVYKRQRICRMGGMILRKTTIPTPTEDAILSAVHNAKDGEHR